jgi:hypothetical protein
MIVYILQSYLLRGPQIYYHNIVALYSCTEVIVRKKRRGTVERQERKNQGKESDPDTPERKLIP